MHSVYMFDESDFEKTLMYGVCKIRQTSFKYNYPSGTPFDNHEVAVESVSIPYAWANIIYVLGNNQFTYSWVVGSTETAYTITIEDGLYELSDINARLQFEMISNGHYLQKDDDNVFYLEFVVNPNTYKFDLNTYVFPTSLPAGYTQPVADTAAGAAAFPGFPTQTFRPRDFKWW